MTVLVRIMGLHKHIHAHGGVVGASKKRNAGGKQRKQMLESLNSICGLC